MPPVFPKLKSPNFHLIFLRRCTLKKQSPFNYKSKIVIQLATFYIQLQCGFGYIVANLDLFLTSFAK